MRVESGELRVEQRLVDANELPLGKFLNPDTEWKKGWNEALDAAASQAPTVNAVTMKQYNELKEENETLRKRLQHLLRSETVRMYDEIDPRTRDYRRDIRQLDAFDVTVSKWAPVSKCVPELHKQRYEDDQEPCGFGEYWISDPVLGYGIDGDVLVVRYASTTTKGRYNWLDDTNLSVCDVTHWMPLPKPPKEV